MPPPRVCNCGKTTCFTCHRRGVNERYRATHTRPHTVETRPRVTDAELDRRTLESLKRDAAPDLYAALEAALEEMRGCHAMATEALYAAKTGFLVLRRRPKDCARAWEAFKKRHLQTILAALAKARGEQTNARL